jgi:hypothetical protein
MLAHTARQQQRSNREILVVAARNRARTLRTRRESPLGFPEFRNDDSPLEP